MKNRSATALRGDAQADMAMFFHRRKNVLYLCALLAVAGCSDEGWQSDNGDKPPDRIATQRSVAKPSAAEHSVIFGSHEVHYNAFNSTFLQPEVADLYGISQSEKLGVALVSVYQKDKLGVGVESSVSGTATNLASQLKKLDFDEIREGNAIYHISTFPITDEENITFTVDVEIKPTGETHEVKWRQTFWQG